MMVLIPIAIHCAMPSSDAAAVTGTGTIMITHLQPTIAILTACVISYIASYIYTDLATSS